MNGTKNNNQPKQKRPLSMDILFIGVISLLAVGSWVVFDVYRALTVTTVPRVLQRQLRPLESDIDDELFADIKTRRRFDEAQLNAVTPKSFIPLDERQAGTTPTPIVTITPSPLASPAAEISPTPQATQSSEFAL